MRGKQLQVYNPYTDECIAEVPDCDVPDMQQAILGAREAFPSWANDYTAKERGEMLRLWHDTYKHNEKMSAEILMKEQVRVFCFFVMFLGKTTCRSPDGSSVCRFLH